MYYLLLPTVRDTEIDPSIRESASPFIVYFSPLSPEHNLFFFLYLLHHHNVQFPINHSLNVCNPSDNPCVNPDFG